MRRITEEEAWATAGPDEPPLLAKAEHDTMESAVALKRWPGFFLVGVSCELDDRLDLYAFDDEPAAWEFYRASAELMARTGRPFAERASTASRRGPRAAVLD